tara:strand:+ start:5801 stop:6460 length:660 start_codon:yes stop_codon:yes gene_type:complete
MYELGEHLWVEPLVEKSELEKGYAFIFDLYKGHFSDVPQSLEYELFQSGRIKLLGLKYKEEIVGVTGVFSHFHALKEIKYAIIHPEYRTKGLFQKIMEIIKEENSHAVILARTDVHNKPMNISLVRAGFQFLSQHTAKDQSQIVWGLNSRSHFQPQVPGWLAGQQKHPLVAGDVKVLSTDKEKMAEFIKQGFVPGMKSFEKYKLFVYMYALEKLRQQAN